MFKILSTKTLILQLFTVFLLLFLISPVQAENKNIKILETKSTEVVKAKAGSGPENIGVITPSEANPEGPMSFAIGKDEEIYILDQLNSRIQVFKNNKKTKTIFLPKDNSVAFRDIEITPDNKLILAGEFFKEGRIDKNHIYILDSEGKVINLIKTEPCAIELQIVYEGKFSGIWNCAQRIASIDGKAVDMIRIPGKLSWDSKRVFYANIIGDMTAIIYRSEENSLSRWEPEVTVYFNMAIANLLGLWEDKKGNSYLGAFLLDEGKDKTKYSNEIIVFSKDLKELGRVKLPAQKVPHEIWRSIKVSSEGEIYQLLIEKRRVRVLRHVINY